MAIAVRQVPRSSDDSSTSSSAPSSPLDIHVFMQPLAPGGTSVTDLVEQVIQGLWKGAKGDVHRLSKAEEGLTTLYKLLIAPLEDTLQAWAPSTLLFAPYEVRQQCCPC